MSRARLGAFAVGAALVLAACGGDGSSEAVDLPEPTAEIARPAGASDASVPQLEFTAATVTGTQLSGTDYVGTDTIVWFWAPW